MIESWGVDMGVEGVPIVNILVVDDFPQWRAQVRRILLVHPEWKIVAEADNGQEAIQLASQLQPNIVVLDLHLPDINGLEAGREIRRRCPNTKIIFLSQQRDSDIIQAAVAVGGATFVFKANANSNLCEAVAASLGTP